MTSDLDLRLSTSLRDRADAGSPIDPAPLLVAAVAGGRRLRRRRLVVAGVVAAVLIGSGAVAALPIRPHGTPGRPALTMPDAPGVPGAAERPDLVGADPATVHFSENDIAAAATSAQWSAGSGSETVAVIRPDAELFLTVGRGKDTLPVGRGVALSGPTAGRLGELPATLRYSAPTQGRRTWSAVWQPVPGVWADGEVVAGTWAQAERLLTGVRFDRATRCAVPFRLTYLPADVVVQACEVSVTAAGFQQGYVIVGAGSRTLRLRVTRTSRTDQDRQLWRDTWYLHAGRYDVRAEAMNRSDPFREADAFRVLDGFQPVGEPDDPSTW